MTTAQTGAPRDSPYVAIIGPREADERDVEIAHEAGGLLARRGAVVVCGGLGGVMEAACRGAAAHGGWTLGLLPGRDRAAGNAYLSLAVPTGLGEMRNALVVNAADAVIAIGGSWGTLSEIALAMRAGKPTFVLGGWQIGDPLGRGAAVREVSSAGEAVDAVFAALHRAGRSPTDIEPG